MLSKFTELVIPAGQRLTNFKSVLSKIIGYIKKYVTLSLSKFTGYWASPVAEKVEAIKSTIIADESKTQRLVISALLSAIAVILQAAGALGGPGFALSALVTLPIALATILAVPTGIMAYITTLCLLFVLQPSEIIVFPFTTGLLGIGIGFAFRFLNKRVLVIAFAAFSLTVGVFLLLYIFKFPILGPSVSDDFNISMAGAIYAFALLYSWLWVEVSMIFLKLLGKVLKKSNS